ncbi:MAG TPA: hypothetical protein VFU16_04315 [Solirubrobacterales bacterium]|nr:hypothetical protein [Solirubrobacterales bacterium]
MLQLLAERFPEADFLTGVADRSILGPCTLTIRPLSREVELDEVAAWLEEQPGVDVVAPKKSDMHVRLDLDVLRAWLAEGWQEALAPPEGAPQPVTVAVPVDAAPRSLDRCRKVVIGRSVVALLEQQGHEVEVTASDDEDVWLWNPEAEAGPLRVDVAEVDVKHDRMRARHGGIVTLQNLRDDVREDAIALEGRKRDDAYADALVSYLMTHVRRKRRLGTDNEKVGRKLEELDEILSARDLAQEKRGEGSGGEAGGAAEVSEQADTTIRALIAQVEMAADVTAGAARSHDPAPVNRLLRSLGEEIGAVEGLPAGDPLWAAAAEALENALRVVAPGLDHAQKSAA